MITNNIKSWKKVKLADICDLVAGYAFKSRDFGNFTDKVIKITNIEPPIVNMERLIGVTLSNYKKNKLKKYEVCAGDYVLAMTGATIGKLGKICSGQAYINQRVLTFRCKPEVDKRFLFYILSTQFFRKYITNHIDSESAQANISAKSVGGFKILLPPLETQKKIAGVLSALDDKIELNNKINENLEQQAQALFKSWFIDFEPFGGKMPGDWKIHKLADFLPVLTGKKNASIATNRGKYPFFTCSQDILYTDGYSFEGNAILVAGNGDFNIKFYDGKFEAYQRTYVLIPYNPRFTAWLYYVIKSNFLPIINAARGSVINFITKSNLENLSFVAPNNLDTLPIIDMFDLVDRAILENRCENQTLAEIRDALLPKLMSGEIDVDKVEITDKIS